LETGNDRVLDFAEILDSLGLIDEEIWSSGIWTETPNFTGISDIPSVIVGKDTISAEGQLLVEQLRKMERPLPLIYLSSDGLPKIAESSGDLAFVGLGVDDEDESVVLLDFLHR